MQPTYHPEVSCCEGFLLRPQTEHYSKATERSVDVLPGGHIPEERDGFNTPLLSPHEGEQFFKVTQGPTMLVVHKERGAWLLASLEKLFSPSHRCHRYVMHRRGGVAAFTCKLLNTKCLVFPARCSHPSEKFVSI